MWFLYTTCLNNSSYINHIRQNNEWKARENNARNNSRTLTLWILRRGLFNTRQDKIDLHNMHLRNIHLKHFLKNMLGYFGHFSVAVRVVVVVVVDEQNWWNMTFSLKVLIKQQYFLHLLSINSWGQLPSLVTLTFVYTKLCPILNFLVKIFRKMWCLMNYKKGLTFKLHTHEYETWISRILSKFGYSNLYFDQAMLLFNYEILG